MAYSSFNRLCLECGLCCNGVIFARGELQPGDDPERLKALGLRLIRNASKPDRQKFHQPCAALNGCRCEIYSSRPRYCRDFKCLVFSSVESGERSPESARTVVRGALRRVARVRRLLRLMGDEREDIPLGTRFRGMQKEFENGTPEPEAAARFGELTLAMQKLNFFLAENFYPG